MATNKQIERARMLAVKGMTDMATGYGCLLIYKGKVISEGFNQRDGIRLSKSHECPIRS
jgi:hypothetical protein